MPELTLIPGGLDFSEWVLFRDSIALSLIMRDIERNLDIYSNKEYCNALYDACKEELKKRGVKA